VAVNPKYKELAQGGSKRQGDEKDGVPSFYWPKEGDTIMGTITYVGDFWDKPNRFYKPEEKLFDANGTPVIKKAQGTPTVTVQKIQLTKPDGETVNIYFEKPGHFEAIADGLEAAGLQDMTTGLKFRGERMENDDKKHVFEFKFKK
jgi:hypothetical protein